MDMRRFAFALTFAAVLLAQGAAAQEVNFTLLHGAELTTTQSRDMASQPLPTGPMAGGTVTVDLREAATRQSAYRLPNAAISTHDMMAALRADVVQAGYKLHFECHAIQCGGFDFRFALDLLPEPEMHVDLGDFRYLQADLGAGNDRQTIAVLVSKSRKHGFVHITRLGGGVLVPQKDAPSMAPEQAGGVAAFGLGKTTILHGISFASGKASVISENPAAMADLAQFLKANPRVIAALTGHTDTQGSADGNLALSLARAKALGDTLMARFAIAPDRITATGRGGQDPIASNDTRDGRAQNRRVDVTIMPHSGP